MGADCLLLFQDLDEDDVMVLDSGDEIYVWVGKQASPEEKELSLKMAEVSSRNLLVSNHENFIYNLT